MKCRNGLPIRRSAVHSRTGELRFAPRGDLEDLRGAAWSLDGDRSVLALEVRDGRVSSERYPDALGRGWSALRRWIVEQVRAAGLRIMGDDISW